MKEKMQKHSSSLKSWTAFNGWISFSFLYCPETRWILHYINTLGLFHGKYLAFEKNLVKTTQLQCTMVLYNKVCSSSPWQCFTFPCQFYHWRWVKHFKLFLTQNIPDWANISKTQQRSVYLIMLHSADKIRKFWNSFWYSGNLSMGNRIRPPQNQEEFCD